MKTLSIYLILFCISLGSLFAQYKEITESDLICNQYDSEDYLFCKIGLGSNIDILYNIDFCELISLKKDMKGNLEEKFYILIFDKITSLNVKRNYYNLKPISTQKFKTKSSSLYVVEFNLISHMGLNGYSYLVLDSKNLNKTFKEFDSQKRLTKKQILNTLKI
jgi:hypothetical protein